jgi:hypothetical protein
MASLQNRPGTVAKVLERLKIKRFRRRIATSVDLALSSTLSLLGCLFAAEVAVGRRITKRDSEPPRRREDPAIRREIFLMSPSAGAAASIKTFVVPRVGFFVRARSRCPDNGVRTPTRPVRRPACGRSRCVHFPRCKDGHAASRRSHLPVQDWLKLNEPLFFLPLHRRHRPS